MKDQNNIGIVNKPSMEPLYDYWKACLTDAPMLELPADKSRPAAQSLCRGNEQFSLPHDLTEKLKALSASEGVTFFMTLVAGFQILLYRYSGQDDIVIGTASQSIPSDALVLRTDLAGNPNFHELLTRVKEVVLGAYSHQELPFEKLLEALDLHHDSRRNPLFQVMLILENTADNHQQIMSDYPCDLILKLSENAQGLTGCIDYAADLFEAATITRLIGHFQMLLESIVAQPEKSVSEFNLLTESERQQLLVEWNNTTVSFPKDECIHELFEAQVARTTHAVAAVYEGQQLSYAELNAQANQLAHHLRRLGVKPDTRVAICVHRHLNMLVGMLAVLKAGGAYVPMNPAYPADLLATMIEDSDPVAILTQSPLVNLFSGISKTLPVIALDTEFPSWANLPDTNLDRRETGLMPTNLAYIIYTSGSTGKPKGVMIEHSGVCNMITDISNRYEIGNQDKMLQFAPLTFDVSVQEIFIALTSGATLVLRNDDWLTGASRFWELCEKNGVTVVKLPTAFWQQLIQEQQVAIPASIRLNIIGGEAVNSKVLAGWFRRESYRPKLFNAYGPTETTVNSIIHETSPHALSCQSIGRPIANTRIYILDTNNQPAPIGIAGELYIGGVGIARGYLNQPELTTERFMADPFTKDPNARIYKTGDLVRWLNDGTIEFLGRNDFQVKIRGFRIELGDIEAKLLEHPAVREVAILAHEDDEDFKYLAAYLVLKENFKADTSELRDFLKSKLPEFMIPSAFMFLDALPLTVNGKLNRKALPKPDMNQQKMDASFVAPGSSAEIQLATIWSKILKIKQPSIVDNFFELGGHSLLAMQMIIRIEDHFAVKISLNTLFETPTIAELAKLIENTDKNAVTHSKRIIPRSRSDYRVK